MKKIFLVIFFFFIPTLFFCAPTNYKDVGQKMKETSLKKKEASRRKREKEKEIIDKARENFLFIYKSIKIIGTTDYDFGFYIMYSASKENKFYIDGWCIIPDRPCTNCPFEDQDRKHEIDSYFDGFNNGGFSINGASIPEWKNYSSYYYNYSKEERSRILRVAKKLSKLNKEKFLKKLKNNKLVIFRFYHLFLLKDARVFWLFFLLILIILVVILLYKLLKKN